MACSRTGSAANVGADQGSLRQRKAVAEAYAYEHGSRIMDGFYDAVVSGAAPIEARSE